MKKVRHYFLFLTFLIFISLFIGCQTTQIEKGTKEFRFQEETIEIIQGETKDRKSTWHCIKIDLDAPGIEILILPNEIPLNEEKSLSLMSVKNAVKKNNATVGINTTPFAVNKGNISTVGIVKVDGKEISPPNEKYAALCFSSAPLRAHIIPTQTKSTLENFSYAIGGFWQILENGKKVQFKKIKTSRSAAATSHNGRYLYLFAVTPKFSLFNNNGMTYEECATLLSELGCTDALQFDGGKSTSLVFADEDENQITVLEKPLFQRKVPAVLLIKK